MSEWKVSIHMDRPYSMSRPSWMHRVHVGLKIKTRVNSILCLMLNDLLRLKTH